MSFTIDDNPLKNILVTLQEITSYDDDNDDNNENERNLFNGLF